METIIEKADICLCMYIFNISLDQQSIFLMVFGFMLFRCMAMGPPACKLWLPIWATRSLLTSRFMCLTAFLTTWFIRVAVTCLAGGEAVMKYVLIIAFGLFVWAYMCFIQQIYALIGQHVAWSASSYIVWLCLPVS